MRKYLLDAASRTVQVYDTTLPTLYVLSGSHPLPVPDHLLTSRTPLEWGPHATLAGRYATAQALLQDVLCYYDIERGTTDETARVGATLASVFARPYADHVLRPIRVGQTLLTAEDVLFWLVDQLLQGLEHPERRTATAVLTYLCNLLLHKEVVHERRDRSSGGDPYYVPLPSAGGGEGLPSET